MADLLPSTRAAAPRELAMLAWIHDHAPYGVITTDRDFRIQSWNRWIEHHTGARSSAVLGRPLFEIFPDLLTRGLDKRFHRALQGETSLLSTALHGYLLPMPSTGRDVGFELMQQTARIAPLAYSGEIVGTVVVIEDVTDREVQARTLRRQRERHRILSWALGQLLETHEPQRRIRDLFFKVAEQFDFDAYLLYLVEPDGPTLRLQAAGGLFPETEQALSVVDGKTSLGKFFLDLKAPAALEHLNSEPSPAAELSGPLALHACAVVPLVTAGGFLGALAFGTCSRATIQEDELDLLATISKYLALALQREATRAELHATQVRLNQHTQELERLVAERTSNLQSIIAELETFSYTLAHDLRAPIRALIGYSEALREDFATVIPPDASELIARLHRSCRQLDGLTRDLLEYSRVSRQDMQLEPIDLESVVSEIMALAPPGQPALQVHRPLYRVIGHRSSLQQCLANLIDNAFKFAKDGFPAQVRLWTELNPETLPPLHLPSAAPFTSARREMGSNDPPGDLTSGARGPGRVRIIVEDEGIGIPAEAHDKIFGIFERGTSSAKYPGSGIGLAIVARAIQRMGGTCGVQSKLGSGSRFWLELPAV